MQVPTLAGFTEYVGFRGCDYINNESWKTCAVGSYLAYINISIKGSVGDLPNIVLEVHSPAVSRFVRELESVDNGGCSLYVQLNQGVMDSYSELHDWILEAISG